MDTALDILFLDSGGFPVGEAETALSELPVPVPPGAAGARVELQAGGFSLVYVTDPRLSGQPVEVIPQNAAAVHDGDLFASPRPRYHFKWQDGDGGALTFGLRVRRLTAEQAAQALLSAAAAHRIETEALRLEAERLRGALADIYNSRAWRAVRVYYGVKDGIKKLLRGFPAVWRLARRAAA
ncbi:MAG: hypothetical protein FWG93_07965, partial [Oscillospiraceae bacterium]|nr:hypothetical protein [Oscillospiraceae bacterium]